LGLLGVVVSGCSDADADADAAGDPKIVVTTNILGDVVREVVADAGADVEVVMPLGADPHEFAASTRQAEAMVDADLLIVNGAGFEEGMEEIIDRAADAGTPTFAFADHVDLLPLTGPHAEEEAAEGHTDDPHIWTDPTRIAEALPALIDALGEVEGIDATGVVAQNTADYAAELVVLDEEIEAAVAGIPEASRVLVTNHEVFGYFADRYGFEVVGTVIPSGTTLAEPSSGELEELAAVIEDRGVPAIFGETTQSTRLADALAESIGADVEVVELYTESLGEPDSGAETYVGLMRTDAELISGALS
jgi:zinc/manganese transport system substrate-binding protein